MKIAIDARFYGEAGPGRYVSELLKNIELVDRENDYTVFLKSSNYGLYHPVNPRFRKVLADFHWYSLTEQIIFPILLYRGHFDLVHFTQINVPLFFWGRSIVTIHDVILHEFSTERGNLLSRVLYRLKRIPYHLVFLKDVFSSMAVIVPSLATKTDLLKYYSVDEKKIFAIHESVDHYPSGKAASESLVLETYGIKKPYLLCLGSFYPHKNTQKLVEVFWDLKKSNIFEGRLVLVGKESPFSEMLRRFVDKQQIADVVFPGFRHRHGYLPDAEVETILANAFLYVQPSLKEGFGIPPVEAMVFGVPVVASDISCFREMCSGAAVYFNPGSAEDMAKKMARVLSDEVLRSELIRKGYENVKRFSWNRMAEETLAVYLSKF